MTPSTPMCEPLQIAEQATGRRRAFRADAASAAKHANPNRRGKLWIPVILLAQIAFKVLYSGVVSEKHMSNRKRPVQNMTKHSMCACPQGTGCHELVRCCRLLSGARELFSDKVSIHVMCDRCLCWTA